LAGIAIVWRNAKNISKHGMQSRREIPSEPQARGHNNAGQRVLRFFQRMINCPERHVDDTLMFTSGDEPVHESNRNVGWINDLGQLSGRSGRLPSQFDGHRSVVFSGGSERGTRTPDPRIMILQYSEDYGHRRPEDYLPLQFGVRLLRKASIPSRKSSLM